MTPSGLALLTALSIAVMSGDVGRVFLIDQDLDAFLVQGRQQEGFDLLGEGQDAGEQRDGAHLVGLQHGRQLDAHLVGDRRGREPDIARLDVAQLGRGGGIADHGEFVFLQYRRDGEMDRRAPGGQKQIDLVVGDQLLVDAHRLGRIRLIVIDDEFDRPLGAADIESALGVDLVAPQLIGVELRGRCGREEPGLGDRESDPHRIGGLGRHAGDAEARCQEHAGQELTPVH